DLGQRLEDRDGESGDQTEEQDRTAEDQRHLEGVPPELENGLGTQWKLLTSAPIRRFQPSTRTKTISLKGSEISAGGSVIMPIEVRIAATTMSRTRNGM